MSGPPASFRFPTGVHCRLDRAIVFNGALTWRHALPAQAHHWSGLRRDHVDGIARLARALQDVEKGLGPAKRWSPSCWEILQWWEPALADWSSGRRALLTPRRHTPQEALALLQGTALRCACRNDLIEVLIPRRLSCRPRS